MTDTANRNVPIVVVDNLSFTYEDKEILKNVDFRAYAHQLVTVIGPNGAGKSTLFKCILRFLDTYEGLVKLKGSDIKKMSRPEIAKHIAYIPQTTIPVFNYAVEDIVLMGLTGGMKPLEMPRKEHIEKVHEVLDSLGILHLRERGFGRISGGERQLALIARAIVQDAEVLLMDEPTANLDYGNQHRVMERIRGLVDDGYTVITSTHDPAQTLLFADKTFVLKNGKVRAAGPPEEVMTEELLRDIYGLDVKLIDTTYGGKATKACVPVK